LLNESGKWSADAIERSLAHADVESIRGTYKRGMYWDERIAMHRWGAITLTNFVIEKRLAEQPELLVVSK
jgi:hypothetical protein